MFYRARMGLAAACLTASLATNAQAFEQVRTDRLVSKVDDTKILVHLRELQAIADRRGGNRASATRGYLDSVRYVRSTLAAAGYDAQARPFQFDLFTENALPVLTRIGPDPTTFTPNVDFATAEYSAKGDVRGVVARVGHTQVPPPAEPGSTSGCVARDFNAVAGRIALIQRGTCPFLQKVRLAEAAGAVGAIIFNEGQPERDGIIVPTFSERVTIPVLGATYALGRQFYEQSFNGAVRVRLVVDATTETVASYNVIADLPGRNADRTVVVGAHLDSVEAGPGINDNGSGAAALLTIASEFKALGLQPQNTVRFAFWGGEESGLRGSTHYVTQLTDAQRAKIALNLNFDMLGSPNFVRFVYDGDGSIGDPGPPGSDIIEQVFTDFFDSRNLPSAPTLFDGRSDYFAFIEAGIPAGGLFSGAEDRKTAEEAERFGGAAGEPYDACYHQACDTIANVKPGVLRQMAKAAAHAVYTFAMTKEDVRAAPTARSSQPRPDAAAKAEYRGPNLVR